MSNDLDGWVRIEIPDLTMEQQFEIVKAQKAIGAASDEDLREMFMKMFTVYLQKDNLNKQLLSEKFDMPISKIHNVDRESLNE